MSILGYVAPFIGYIIVMSQPKALDYSPNTVPKPGDPLVVPWFVVFACVLVIVCGTTIGGLAINCCFASSTKVHIEKKIFAIWKSKGFISDAFYQTRRSPHGRGEFVSIRILWKQVVGNNNNNNNSHHHQQQHQHQQHQHQQHQHVVEMVPSTMPAVGLMAAPTVATGQTNPLEQLKRLKSLLDIDAITQQEYDQKKKELLELV